MLKNYQLKWCLRFIVILIVATSLTRSAAIYHLRVLEFVQFSLDLSISVFACWMTLGYVLEYKSGKWNSTFKHIAGNIAGWVVLLIANSIFAHYFPDNQLINDAQFAPGMPRLVARCTGSFFLSIVSYIVLNNLRTNETLQRSVLEIELLKQAHLRAQLLSLQQQVSPHFLFNALSTLKTISQDQEAKDYIVQLSKVYRHLLNFNEYHLTTLKDELAFLKSYLYILNMRFEDSLFVDMNIDEQYLHYSIPPLSLQLLVENAIKHNITTPEHPLRISIFTSADAAITIENNYAPKPSENEASGMGLQNINDRYELLIHKPISVSAADHKFTVTLPLLSI